MRIQAVGIDAVDVARFRSVLQKKKDLFLKKTFSEGEYEYCFSHRDPAVHFAGTFAAKEAIQKALGDFRTPMRELEVRREKSGKPHVWICGRRSARILVSITHDGGIACAIALKKGV